MHDVQAKASAKPRQRTLECVCQSGGFTLVELMIVVGIISIVAMTLVTRLDSGEMKQTIKLRDTKLVAALGRKYQDCIRAVYTTSSSQGPYFSEYFDLNSDNKINTFDQLIFRVGIDCNENAEYHRRAIEVHLGIADLGGHMPSGRWEHDYDREASPCDLNSDGIISSKDIQYARSIVFYHRKYSCEETLETLLPNEARVYLKSYFGL